MDVDKLNLLYFWDFSQDIFLSDILDPCAFVSRAKVKDRLSYQKFLRQRIIDPFLHKPTSTSIYCCRMVLLGECINESFSNLKVILSCSWLLQVK